MGQCSSKYKINSVVPYGSENVSELYIKKSVNLTKRRIKRTRSKIIYEGLKGIIA